MEIPFLDSFSLKHSSCKYTFSPQPHHKCMVLPNTVAAFPPVAHRFEPLCNYCHDDQHINIFAPPNQDFGTVADVHVAEECLRCGAQRFHWHRHCKYVLELLISLLFPHTFSPFISFFSLCFVRVRFCASCFNIFSWVGVPFRRNKLWSSRQRDADANISITNIYNEEEAEGVLQQHSVAHILLYVSGTSWRRIKIQCGT